MRVHHSVRSDYVDALRGLAMVWMTGFHFCFDLNHFHYIQTDFYRDPVWTVQRVAIVSLFVFCAGLGQALALQHNTGWGPFWRRWRLVAAGALLVTASSYWIYPASFIYFGILHGMAVMLILVRWLAPAGRVLWVLGAAAVAAPMVAPLAHVVWPWLHFLNEPAFNWLGLISQKPITEDYAPVLPWLGVMLWGMAAGQWISQNHPRWLQSQPPKHLQKLATLGRWSLSYYLVHQPIMLGVFWLIQR